MSDENKVVATVDAAEPEVSAGPEPMAAAASAATGAPAPAPSRLTAIVAWLALLVAAVVAAGGGWYVLQTGYQLALQQQSEAALANRVVALEADRGRDQAVLDALEERLRRERQDAAAALKEADRALDDKLSAQAQLLQQQSGSLTALDDAIDLQREEIARFNISDREQWLLSEAEYLLRLANQRLIMASDVEAAQRLLNSADAIIREIDDVAFHAVRSALAQDLAALRALPDIDTQGLYLRLGALIAEADTLTLYKRLDAPEKTATETDLDWQQRLQQGYEAALAKLSQYVTVTRRDLPFEALMDPQWEGLVRQNLRMLLEQSQAALLTGNQALFEESLQRASHWLREFFRADETAAGALSDELIKLQSTTITVPIPDISRSLQALDSVIASRTREA